LVTFSIILASSITVGAWRYQVATTPPITYINPEDIATLTITTDTTLTQDYVGEIVIAADGVTLDGAGHRVIGPGPDVWIWELDEENASWPELDEENASWPRPPIGILLEGRTGVTVKNCRVANFSYGFFLGGSDGNTLQGNTANDNGYGGFSLESSSNNILLNNTANGNGSGDTNGFYLGRSFENTLQGNTANDHWIGFVLEESDGNSLIGNTAKDNARSGFEVAFSRNNTLTGNTASNNNYGMSFGDARSRNNRIYHNNFVNNIKQVDILNSVNAWDEGYPSGGNYWSDYKGVDANGDGIGDTPYVIDENNVDRFPLMAPISVFDDST
jgi:parallel beta-helix repeat protein